jgi:hypothetical protein
VAGEPVAGSPRLVTELAGRLSLSVVTTWVFIATSGDRSRDSLDTDWHLAGWIDESREQELWKVVQRYIGLRSSREPSSVEFYAHLDPDSPGYHLLLDARPDPHREKLDGSNAQCWLALAWDGPPRRMLFSVAPAVLAPLARRPPTHHPGLVKPGTPVGMRLRSTPERSIFAPS